LVVVGAVEKSTTRWIPLGARNALVRKLWIVPSRPVVFAIVKAPAERLDGVEGLPVGRHVASDPLVGM
jgi:hypothetical protein